MLTATGSRNASSTNTQIKLVDPVDRPRSRHRPGVIIAEATATNLPGATTTTPPGPMLFALVGNACVLLAVPGKAYNLTGSSSATRYRLRPKFREPGCRSMSTGYRSSSWNCSPGIAARGFDSRFRRRSFTASLLTESVPQSISTKVFGDDGCEPNTTLEVFRMIVTEVG